MNQLFSVLTKEEQGILFAMTKGVKINTVGSTLKDVMHQAYRKRTSFVEGASRKTIDRMLLSAEKSMIEQKARMGKEVQKTQEKTEE